MEGQKSIIADTYVFDREVYESTVPAENSTSGVLRVIKGPVAEYKKLNRNNRMYSERLWDNVLESSYVKEQLGYKTLYGECNHPESRYEVDFGRVSHSIVDMWKVPDRNQIYAEIQILDTPFGRILNTLYEAGGILGYSSRAGGTLHQRKDYTDVDEKTYNFITFDAVPFPSVEAARPGAIQEGSVPVTKLSDEVHDTLCKIIEGTTSNNRSLVKDFIYSLEGFDMTPEKQLLESGEVHTMPEPVKKSEPVIEQKNVENVSEDANTIQLLKESSLQIARLKAANQTLTATKESLVRENESLKQSLNSSLSRVTELLEGYKGIETKIDISESRLADTIKQRESRIAELESELSDKDDEISSFKSIEEACRALRYENASLKRGNQFDAASQTELETLRTKVRELDEQVAEAYSEISKMVMESSDREASIHEMELRITDLMEDRDELVRAKKRLLSENKQLAEMPVISESAEREVKTLKQENENLSTQVTTLNESLGSAQQVLESYKQELVSVISGGYNLTAEEVLPHLKEGFTKADVYCICESMGNATKQWCPTIVSEGSTPKIDSTQSRVPRSIYSNLGSRRGKALK